MSLELLETIFYRINEYLAENRQKRIEILWHGGEPLLLGPDYFRSAIQFQEKHCFMTKNRINHSIQTNLTCCDNAFVEIFKELGIASVGTSYDPEPHMRGPGKGIDSDRYNGLFMKALGLLERQGIGWHIIYVVTKKSLHRPLPIFLFLTNLSLTGGFSMNPVYICGDERKDIAITPEEYSDFLGAIFPYWWKYRERHPYTQPFSGLTKNIVEGSGRSEHFGFGICDSAINNIVIAPDGESSQNGMSLQLELPRYGNIGECTLNAILNNYKVDQFVERVKELGEKECKDCRFFTLCHDEISIENSSEYKILVTKSEWCRARIGFIEKYFEPVTGVKFESRKQENCKK